MFSRMQLLADTEMVASRFGVDVVKSAERFLPKTQISGFDHAAHPIIITNDRQLICDDFNWGLVPPDWRKRPEDIHNHTISAKLEYLDKRYSWQQVSNNRCLVPVTAYFEYHWKDVKGNSKTKYIIKNTAEELFALAGLFSIWHNPQGGFLQTFAVCTTTANETMQFVHNKDAAKNYHRMPVMLNRADEKSWLDQSTPYMDFAFPTYQPELVAIPIEQNMPVQTKLF
jgi:putative SOS response-associated peptidase YedK